MKKFVLVLLLVCTSILTANFAPIEQALRAEFNRTVPSNIAHKFTAFGGESRLSSSGLQRDLGNAAVELEEYIALQRMLFEIQMQSYAKYEMIAQQACQGLQETLKGLSSRFGIPESSFHHTRENLQLRLSALKSWYDLELTKKIQDSIQQTVLQQQAQLEAMTPRERKQLKKNKNRAEKN